MCDHIGKGGHNLLFWGQVGALFEFKVADCAGQGEVSIDSAKVDKATCSSNSSFLAFRGQYQELPSASN